MDLGIPNDITFYKFLTDWGGLIGAVAALIAAIFAYIGICAQIKEAREENRENREVALQNRVREELLAASVVDAALEVFKYDLYHVRNTFDPGEGDPQFDNQPIQRERAQWLRQRLRALIFEPVLPYLDRLEHEAAEEYLYISFISERARDDESPTTYGELRELLKTLGERVQALQKAVNTHAESVRARR
jgi:hypothetical protein